ncbi:hypothetical protein N4P55_15065 [Pseudomonas fluorescens]|uniref:hypothetical protein n=1 Tax=Pseudomonas fluorescens TaxID=294 RepID=UPI0021D09422|nr:hypothetical protein [Pseudomonas fluorescens]UXV17227.1 hypothetical protein N4P55_15065 [Pseudomonas fluorescens]
MPIAPIDERADMRMKQGERLKAMAPTHTQSEVPLAPGKTSKMLKSLAAPCCFTFKRLNHGGYNGMQRQKKLEVRDAKFAEGIEAFKEPGVSRPDGTIG